MGIENSCFLVTEAVAGQQGQGQEYCSSEQEKLRVFVNGNELEAPSSISDYILKDDDRILVLYGNQTAEQQSQELKVLEEVPILKT
jgi:hypothetical protein